MFRGVILKWIGPFVTVGLLSLPLMAQPATQQQEALQWLQKVAVAAQKLNYSGTFVFSNGRQSETSRIVHAVINGAQMEKLEVLDGSPREVIRLNDEVKSYLPDQRLIIIEQRSAQRNFPALLPVSLTGLNEFYLMRKGETVRVAGIDSQMIRLEPLDDMRYGREYWVDRSNGLLLKADIFDAEGESLESLAFTELQIGVPNNLQVFKSRFSDAPEGSEGWKVRQAELSKIQDDTRWQFATMLPGFKRQAAMQRHIAHANADDKRMVLHWIFSDGLAAMSVFIAPLKPQTNPATDVVHSLGAMSVMKRVIDNHQVIVMGDVPPAAIRAFASGIKVRQE